MIRRSHSVRERLGNRLLSGEELLSRGGNLSGYRNKHYAYSPEEIQHTGPYHEIRIPLPYMEKEDLDVSVVNGMLMIKGESVEEISIEENGYIKAEKDMRSFESVFDLDDRVDVDKICATFMHNELVLRLYLCDEGTTCDILSRQIPIT